MRNASIAAQRQTISERGFVPGEVEIKGRVKEAAGAITDNDELRREGEIDQAAGKVKQATEKVVEKGAKTPLKDASKH